MALGDDRAAFFYGTLMAPQVLHRVCYGSSDPNNPNVKLHNLKIIPAVLDGYERHRVRDADYPAIIPIAGASVRGTYVTGLTHADIWRLDIFEGPEYRRERVRARLQPAEASCAESDGQVVEAETYVFKGSPDGLEDGEWDFEEFKREKMCFWIGAEGAGEYAEVDEAVKNSEAQPIPRDGTGGRGVNGHITKALVEEDMKHQVSKSAV